MLNVIADKFVYPLRNTNGATDSLKHLYGSGAPCLWFQSPKGKRAVVFLHGNKSKLDSNLATFIAQFGLQAQADVLAVTYPGYPGSIKTSTNGSAYVEDCALHCACAYREVASKYKEVWLMGHSLGCAHVMRASLLCEPRGLILLSPFASLKTAVRHLYGEFLAWLCPDFLDNVSIAHRLQCPVLILHGLDDNVVPSQQSNTVFNNLTLCKHRKRILLSGVHHALNEDFAREAGTKLASLFPAYGTHTSNHPQLQFRNAPR